MYKFIYVPLDNRPVNFNRFILWTKLYCSDIFYPPKDLLGNLSSSGNGNKICKWLIKLSKISSKGKKIFLISNDMLCYGGLFFSRKLNTTFNGAWQRLLALKEIKNKNNKIFVFSIIPRLSISVSNMQEKIYWEKIFQYSKLAPFENKDSHTQKIIAKIKKEIPTYLLEDYLTCRRRNLNINLKLLELVKNKFIDFLVLAQEDAYPEGLHIQEQKILKQEINKNNLQKKIEILTGADEIAYLLFTKIVVQKEKLKPTLNFYFSEEEAKKNIPLYEDKTLEKNLQQKYRFLFGEKITKKKSNWIIFVNTFKKKQLDLMFTENIAKNNFGEILSLLEPFTYKKNYLMFWDLKYANGGDYYTMKNIFKVIPPLNFIAYSGWNTASNSLGTLFAHLILYYFNFKKNNSSSKTFLQNHLKLLFLEFCDELIYQGYVRRMLIKEAEDNYISVWNFKNKKNFMQKKLNEILIPEISKFFQEYFLNKGVIFRNKKFKISGLKNLQVYFPWDRLFEVDIKCQLNLK